MREHLDVKAAGAHFADYVVSQIPYAALIKQATEKTKTRPEAIKMLVKQLEHIGQDAWRQAETGYEIEEKYNLAEYKAAFFSAYSTKSKNKMEQMLKRA